jgi:hypothetical protein
MQTLVGIAAFVGMFVLAYWIFLPWDRRRKDMERSRSWPAIEARVVATSSRTFSKIGQANWWVDYEYEVDSQKCRGRMTNVSQQPFVSDISIVYPEGSKITVRYNPSHVAESVAIGNPK